MKFAFAGWSRRHLKKEKLTMKIKILLIICLLAVMSGCIGPQEAVQSWVGADVNDLIAIWGPPNQVIDNDAEGKIMVWRTEGSCTTPNDSDYHYGRERSSSFTITPFYFGAGCDIPTISTFWVEPHGGIYRASYVENSK